MHGPQNSRLLDALIARLGGRIIVRPQQSPEIFGWSAGTSHNMIARGELLPLRHFGGKVTGWLVPDLLEHFANAPPSRLVGRARPAARMHAAELRKYAAGQEHQSIQKWRHSGNSQQNTRLVASPGPGKRRLPRVMSCSEMIRPSVSRPSGAGRNPRANANCRPIAAGFVSEKRTVRVR